MNNKVMIGMSGGVDSSVAAYLLKEQGYEVIGVFMKLWEGRGESERACCSLSAAEDARRVADRIGIPFYVINMKKPFMDKVVDYFVDEYLQGRTPNPCIACNKHIKFDEFLKKAIMLGCDHVATGHYAKVEYSSEHGRFLLKKSATDEKDQTYALYNMTQEQLSRTVLPLGTYNKGEIREIASSIGLVTANKPDSQEICFVEDDDYASFVKNMSKKKIQPGNFVDRQGNVLGRHEGIIKYTIGQRKGLGIALGWPAYVVDIDPKTNSVVLGTNEDVFKKGLVAGDINVIPYEKIEDGMKVQAKVRYNARPKPATVYNMDDGRIKVVFDDRERAITPGQSVVMYQGDIVVGGGIIESSLE
ncbi:tRNA-specific 2-thiouridylase MnmA [Peptoclostridium acidaminophilum DSM 3953]|uniref:tRNA-specific 2-thiouridylase MnmA n=1 Tax=Peptoclostridium acidaminophilum DSM 3953 TaxID=1286171 RepID=W8U6J5_PEPAC|nr:tRNA 2-thiouridine(34) synthase MnmA [Peptoclostridium acidaminophilum]AHM56546.1 tRNA-specific 2-thiouridylase MnmA [Peptoclostridium acidaminophilum DSM 3953]